jgi:hypothetical protein
LLRGLRLTFREGNKIKKHCFCGPAALRRGTWQKTILLLISEKLPDLSLFYVSICRGLPEKYNRAYAVMV